MKIEIPIYHDVWMEDGIEDLYRISENKIVNAVIDLGNKNAAST
jgi:hypothetical protein